jgi:8-oxo-dGTP pyrophosphatase MutT (NUDIX family)
VTQDVPPRIFIGSSSESLRVAQGIKANLEELAEVRIWNEGLFTPGRYTLEELLGFTGSFDFAIFIWNSDDSLTSRGSQFTVARDNVVLETGVFYGVLGRERVFLCAPQSLRVRTPSDLLGMKVLSFQEPSDGNYRSATSSASSEVAAHVRTLGPMPRTMAAGDDLAEIAVYESFLTARQDITRACIKAQAIKIFANKGLAFFGLDDSSISLAEVREYSRLRRIRVLLMDPESPWISNGFIALRHYESIASYKRELESSHAILESSMRRLRSMTSIARSGVRYHAVEPYFRFLMTEDVVFVSSYAEHPSVQVRDLPVFAYRASPGSLYWAFKRHFNDVWHNASRPSPVTASADHPELDLEISAGGIVLATETDEIYVALVQREDGSWVLPKGHRESPMEDLSDTAVREVSEELGLDQASLQVGEKLDEYTSDETAAKHNGRKVTYFFVMRYVGDGLPQVSPDLDHLSARWWKITERLPYLHYAYQRTLLAETVERLYGHMIRFDN